MLPLAPIHHIRVGFLRPKLRVALCLFVFLAGGGSAFGFGKNKVILEGREWKILKTAHFDIYHPDGYEKVAAKTAIFAEEANLHLTRKLNHNLSEVVPIFIYPSHNEFTATNIIDAHLGEGTGGFTEPVKRRVVMPFNGSYDKFRHVLTHELVHAFQFDLLFGGGLGSTFLPQFISVPPLWIMEGSAEYLSIGWDETGDMTVRDAILNGKLPSLQDMTRLRVPSVYIIYKAGQSVMQYIAEVHGEEKIGEIFRDIRDLRDLELAIKNNLDMDLKKLNYNWQRWLKKRYFPILEKKTYPDVGNKVLASHLDDRSFFNFKPTLSPDGKRFAYLSSKEMFPAIYVRQIKEEMEEAEEVKVIQGYRSDSFEQLSILSNSLTWSRDGKYLAFAAKGNSRETVYLVDPESGRVRHKIQPPFADVIEHPTIGPKSEKVYFAGTVRGQTDIYEYTLATKKVRRLTRNMYYESYPAVSPDGKTLYYSSNLGPDNNFESKNYHLYALNLEDGSSRQLTNLGGKALSPDVSPDGKKVVFSNNGTGVYNLYMIYPETGKVNKLTNVAGGMFEPQFSKDGKEIIFSAYENMGYDIIRMDTPPDDYSDPDNEKISVYTDPNYPIMPMRRPVTALEPYTGKFSPDGIFFGFTVVAGQNQDVAFGGFAVGSASDYLGNHRIWAFADYTNAVGEPNFQASYAYLANRIDYYASVFRDANSPGFNLSHILRSNWNYLFHNPYRYHSSIVRYGMEAGASYPFSKFARVETAFEISRDEEEFQAFAPTSRKDFYRNIHAGSIGVVYDNVVYSYAGPMDGFRGRGRVEQGADITGYDLVFTRSWADLRYYFLFFDRHIFALRGFAGTTEGRDAKLIPWQIGGFNTIRAYDYLSLEGTQTFYFNLEYRFPLVDAIIFGWPVQWGIGGFHWVIFFDGGSAFNGVENFDLYNERKGKLRDLKLSFGMGLRMVFLPGLVFSIDWGTPWDLKNALPIDKWSGEFSIGFGF